MPRKKVAKNEIDTFEFEPKRKRNLPAAGHGDENNEKIGKNRKRKKNDTTLHGNTEKAACSTEIIAHSQPVKIIRSAASSSSAKSVSRKRKNCKKECVICLNTEKSSDFTVISCDHSFHTICIQTWFHLNKSCPVCMPITNTSDRSEIGDLYELRDGVECVICMDIVEFSNYEFISCGHIFHSSCLQTWFQIKRICPICMPYSNEADSLNMLVDQEEIGELSEEVRCLICLDTEEYSNFEIISCCHSFHVVCIETWFGLKQACPVCMVNDPSILFKDDAVYEFSDQVECNICIDTKVYFDFQYLSCGHHIHAECIKSWIEENKSCPACMKEISVNVDSNTVKEVKDQQGDRCVICVDTEDSSDFQFLPCCHSFHVECIQNWIKKSKSCPICKTPVNEGVDTSEGQDANTCNNEGENIHVNDRIDADAMNIPQNLPQPGGTFVRIFYNTIYHNQVEHL